MKQPRIAGARAFASAPAPAPAFAIALALALPLVASSSARAVPTTLTYAGVLTDNNVRVDGLHDVVFELFDDDVAGTLRYSEQVNAVVVVDGELVVELGNNNLDDSVLDLPELWLEVTVDGTPLSPRVRLNSVPYALRAEAAFRAAEALLADEALSLGGILPSEVVTDADLLALGLASGLAAGAGINVNGATISIAAGGVGATQLATNAVSSGNIVDGSVTTTKLADGAVTAVKIANATITTTQIAANAIALAQLQSSSVDSSKIVNASVNGIDIADESLTSADLGTSSVFADEIATGAVTTAEILNSTITASDISGGVDDAFFTAPGCERGGLSLSNSCDTVMCAIVSGAPRFFDCNRNCNQTASLSCTNTSAGFIFRTGLQP